jgi:hypothetical protein
MGIIRRLRNLWRMSGIDSLSQSPRYEVFNNDELTTKQIQELLKDPVVPEKPKMAEIIKRKRKDPIEELLEYPDESSRSHPIL